MLNEHDQRELSLIEQRLCSDDRRLVDTFRTARPGSSRSRRWASRALVSFGAFTLLVGLVAGAAGVFLQGLLVLGSGIGWVVLRRRIAVGKGSFRRTGQPRGRPDRDASPERRHPA